MAWNSEPDADKIVKLAKRLEERWGQQAVLDDAMLPYVMMEAVHKSVAKNDDGKPGQAFRSGIGGVLWREDTALMKVYPGIHVNVPTEDPEDEDHASGVLEPWLTAAFRISQQGGEVWLRQPEDLDLLGRAWSNVYHFPGLWADDPEYQKLLKRWEEAEEDSDEFKEIEKEIQAFRRDNWPIRWRYVDPRHTWTTFNGERWLPEVVEVRKMTRADIEEVYGEKALPEGVKGDGMHDSTEIDVYDWANWVYCATVASYGGGERAESKFLKKPFRHNLGRNPYVLTEANLAPPNDKGIRWTGALFYAQDSIKLFDQIIADLQMNHMENTRAPVVPFLDPEARQDSEILAGRDGQMELGPGAEKQAMLAKERLELVPVPQINPQSIALLQEIKELIQQNFIRPVERGQALSGTSQNLFTSQVEIAQREFDPLMLALAEGGKQVCQLMMRCVFALNEGYQDYPDKVYVFTDMAKSKKRKGVIGVGPKDVKGWENAVQLRMQKAIPMAPLIQYNTAQAALAVGLSPATVYEKDLGFENPLAEIRKARLFELEKEAFNQAVQEVVKRAGQKLQQATAGQVTDIARLFTHASPGLQEFLATLGQGGGASPPAAGNANATIPAPPGTLQGMANMRRAGNVQNPQAPGVGVMPNVG